MYNNAIMKMLASALSSDGRHGGSGSVLRQAGDGDGGHVQLGGLHGVVLRLGPAGARTKDA